MAKIAHAKDSDDGGVKGDVGRIPSIGTCTDQVGDHASQIIIHDIHTCTSGRLGPPVGAGSHGTAKPNLGMALPVRPSRDVHPDTVLYSCRLNRHPIPRLLDRCITTWCPNVSANREAVLSLLSPTGEGGYDKIRTLRARCELSAT